MKNIAGCGGKQQWFYQQAVPTGSPGGFSGDCPRDSPGVACAGTENFRGRGGGVQIPRRGLTENFNMAKINNLAIPVGGGGGGYGPPVPPLSGSAHVSQHNTGPWLQMSSALGW